MWPEKNFPGYGTRWGALIFGKSGGGRSNFKILWLDHEIPNPIQIFLTKAGSTELGFRTLPESSKNFVGVSPPHLAKECASGGGIWHTSSKGMPRHAHGRWALVTVCGVDVSHVYVVVRTKRTICHVNVNTKFSQKTSSYVHYQKFASQRNKIGLWYLDFSEYILISPEREMECTQLFCALG